MSTAHTTISSDATGIWRASRGPMTIVALIIAVGITAALLRGMGEDGALDPRSAAPAGSRALATLLEARGVQIARVQTAAAAESALTAGAATLLITTPAWLAPEQLRQLSDHAAGLVLIAPPEDTVRAVTSGIAVAGHDDVHEREPDCGLPSAVAAGTATLGGVGYRADREAELCYPAAGGFALLQLPEDGKPITLLGTGNPLTNAALADEGNAALVLRLLGAHQRLVWYVPSLDDPAMRTGEDSLLDLVPSGWKFALIQIAVAVLLFALWRARRLGPVVTEPLPVVVRAAETAEGRARLYQRAGAADHAADALRSAARSRIAGLSGLSADAEPSVVVAAVATRTGRPPEAVQALLYGPAPADAAALVRLADQLDSLENEVRTR